MSGTCSPHHDWFNALLTFGLCCGLIISYLAQHYRIIHAKSSEGFSPIFLLLGTTSAASTMFNMIILQAPIIKCCRILSFASCLEMSGGVIQVGIQWFCFTVLLILYMIYYPEHLKYVEVGIEELEALLPRPSIKGRLKSVEWRLSIIVAWITGFHFFFIASVTIYLLSTIRLSPDGSIPHQISAWATFMGVTSAILATIQYAPQILHTYRMKLVGALSIPMMLIQTPGGFLVVISIVLRPGTNWTSWITFAVAAILQGCLLVMCIMWKFRQRELNVDDFGNPLHPSFPPPSWSEARTRDDCETHDVPALSEPDNDPVPGLVTEPSENPVAVCVALAEALETAVQTDLRPPTLLATVSKQVDATEQTVGWARRLG